MQHQPYDYSYGARYSRGMHSVTGGGRGAMGMFDTAYSFINPLYRSHMLGEEDPIFIPVNPLGEDPTEVEFRIATNLKLREARQKAGLYDSRALNNILDSSIGRLIDPDSGTMRTIKNLSNLFGVGQALSATEAGKAYYSGPAAMTDYLFARNKSELYDNRAVTNLDQIHSRNIAAVGTALDLSRAVADKVNDPSGMLDMRKTGGLGAEGLRATASSYVATHGVSDVEVDAEAILKHARTLRSVMDIIGSKDFNDAIKAIQAIEGKPFTALDSDSTKARFRALQAEAALIGVDTQAYVGMQVRGRHVAGSVMGISESERSLFGITGGGILPAVGYGIASMEAGMNSIRGVSPEQAAAQATALGAMTAKSGLGQSAQVVASLTALDIVSEEDFNLFNATARLGNASQSRTVLESISRRSGYDIYAMAANPDIIRELAERAPRDVTQRHMTTLSQSVNHALINQREVDTRRALDDRRFSSVARMSGMLGITGYKQSDTEAYADIHMAIVKAYMDPTTEEQTDSRYLDTFLEHTGAITDPGAKLAAARRLLNTSLFGDKREEILSNAASSRDKDRLAKLSTQETLAGDRAGLTELLKTATGDEKTRIAAVLHGRDTGAIHQLAVDYNADQVFSHARDIGIQTFRNLQKESPAVAGASVAAERGIVGLGPAIDNLTKALNNWESKVTPAAIARIVKEINANEAGAEDRRHENEARRVLYDARVKRLREGIDSTTGSVDNLGRSVEGIGGIFKSLYDWATSVGFSVD